MQLHVLCAPHITTCRKEQCVYHTHKLAWNLRLMWAAIKVARSRQVRWEQPITACNKSCVVAVYHLIKVLVRFVCMGHQPAKVSAWLQRQCLLCLSSTQPIHILQTVISHITHLLCNHRYYQPVGST